MEQTGAGSLLMGDNDAANYHLLKVTVKTMLTTLLLKTKVIISTLYPLVPFMIMRYIYGPGKINLVIET